VAAAQLAALAEGSDQWALPVFCITEFLRVATHSRVFSPPSTTAQAAEFIEAVAAAPTCEVVQPGAEFLADFGRFENVQMFRLEIG